MVKNLHIFNSSESYGSRTFFKNIVNKLNKDDYLVINPKDRIYIKKNKNIILSPKGIFKFLFNQIILPFYIYKNNIANVYTHSMVSIFFAGQKNILSIRNVDPFLNNYNIDIKYRIKLISLRYLFYISYYFSKKIIFVSKFSLKVVKKFKNINKEKYIIAYHGVDHIKFINSKKIYDYLFVGKFIHYHNIDVVFNFFNKINKNTKFKFKLLIGEFDNKIKNRVKESYPDIFYKNLIEINLPNKKIIEYMQKSKILIFSSSYEACPFTLLEAMRCGCAVFANDSGPNKEILLNNAIYFDINKFDEMFKSALKLSKNKRKIKILSKKNIENSNKYKWATTKKLISIY